MTTRRTVYAFDWDMTMLWINYLLCLSCLVGTGGNAPATAPAATTRQSHSALFEPSEIGKAYGIPIVVEVPAALARKGPGAPGYAKFVAGVASPELRKIAYTHFVGNKQNPDVNEEHALLGWAEYAAGGIPSAAMAPAVKQEKALLQFSAWYRRTGLPLWLMPPDIWVLAQSVWTSTPERLEARLHELSTQPPAIALFGEQARMGLHIVETARAIAGPDHVDLTEAELDAEIAMRKGFSGDRSRLHRELLLTKSDAIVCRSLVEGIREGAIVIPDQSIRDWIMDDLQYFVSEWKF